MIFNNFLGRHYSQTILKFEILGEDIFREYGIYIISLKTYIPNLKILS